MELGGERGRGKDEEEEEVVEEEEEGGVCGKPEETRLRLGFLLLGFN